MSGSHCTCMAKSPLVFAHVHSGPEGEPFAAVCSWLGTTLCPCTVLTMSVQGHAAVAIWAVGHSMVLEQQQLAYAITLYVYGASHLHVEVGLCTWGTA